MKILVDISWMSAERLNASFSKYVMRLLSGIPALHRDNYCLLFEKDSAALLHDIFPDFNFKTVNLYRRKGQIFPRPRNFFRAINFARAVNNSGCDKVFFPGEAERFMIRYLKLAYVLVIHDLKRLKTDFKESGKGFNAKIRARRMRDRYRHSIPKAAQIIAISDFTLNDVRYFFPDTNPGRLHMVHNSVTVSPLSQKPKALSDSEKYILFINSLEPFKNLHTLVKAYSIIASQIKEKLIIVGKDSGYYRNTILPLIKEKKLENRIIHLQNITDAEIRYLYENASLFVSPSLHEGFGFTPIEAAICMCPVLCSMSDSLPEVTKGQLNYYEPAEDENALAAEMSSLLNIPPTKEKLKEISEDFIQSYSPEKQALEIEKILSLDS
jgi:glycosyltransferase involved in cell wall biosynthesis